MTDQSLCVSLCAWCWCVHSEVGRAELVNLLQGEVCVVLVRAERAPAASA